MPTMIGLLAPLLWRLTCGNIDYQVGEIGTIGSESYFKKLRLHAVIASMDINNTYFKYRGLRLFVLSAGAATRAPNSFCYQRYDDKHYTVSRFHCLIPPLGRYATGYRSTTIARWIGTYIFITISVAVLNQSVTEFQKKWAATLPAQSI